MNNSLVVATIGKTVTLPCRVLMQEVLSSFIPDQLFGLVITSFLCFVLVSFYLIFIPRILSFALSLPLFIQNENFLRAQRSHGRFRGNQRWTFWRWELNLKSCKKLKYLKKYFDGRNINMQKRLLTLGMKSSKIEGKQKN